MWEIGIFISGLKGLGGSVWIVLNVYIYKDMVWAACKSVYFIYILQLVKIFLKGKVPIQLVRYIRESESVHAVEIRN